MILLNILLLGIPQLLSLISTKIFIFLYLKQSNERDCNYYLITDHDRQKHLLIANNIDIDSISNYLSVSDAKMREIICDYKLNRNYIDMSKHNLINNIHSSNIIENKSFYKPDINSDNNYNNSKVSDLNDLIKLMLNSKNKIKYFTFKNNRYFFNDISREVTPIRFDLTYLLNKDIHSIFKKGINSLYVYNRLINLFGKNVISLKFNSFLMNFVKQVFTIQYMYQLAMICIWLYYNYTSFASIVIIISVIILLINSVNTTYNYRKLLQFANYEKVDVIRNFVSRIYIKMMIIFC